LGLIFTLQAYTLMLVVMYLWHLLLCTIY